MKAVDRPPHELYNIRMKWALVLSGGGGRGILHIGVIKALERLGLVPDMIAGASMGALIGGIYASGRTSEMLENYILNEFDVRKYMDGWTFKLPEFPLFRFLQAGNAVGNILTREGLDSGAGFRKEIDRLTGGKHFEDCQIPFRCNATDLLTGEKIVFSSGEMTPALYSSMAYPGVFAPYHWGSRVLSDGAVTNNVPVFIPRRAGIKRVLAVDVTPFHPVEEKDIHNTLGVALRAFDIASNNQLVDKENKPTVQLSLKLASSGFEFSDKEKLITRGEELVEEKKARIVHAFAPAPRSWFYPLMEPKQRRHK